MLVKNIAVFIISFNRLKCLKALVFWFENQGFENINIIDNASTCEQLREYLANSKHHVWNLTENLGHLALFKCGLFDDVVKREYFILTDPDVIPTDEVPDNWLEVFKNALDSTNYNKVGFSLKIDDIPTDYEFKDLVLRSEKKHWKNWVKIDGVKFYKASIDTIFALYRPNTKLDKNWFKGLRCEYEARHLGWYEKEPEIYTRNCQKASTTWSFVHDRNKIQKLLGIGALNFLKKYIKLSLGYIKQNPNFLFKKEFYKKIKEVMRENS